MFPRVCRDYILHTFFSFICSQNSNTYSFYCCSLSCPRKDVQQLVSELREHATRQQSNEKRKMARLDAQIAKYKAAMDNEAATAATASKTPPLPAGLAGGGVGVGVGAGETTAKGGTTVSSAQPQPQPQPPGQSWKPWKTNATFQERIQELEHFRKGNGHCRVPLRQMGLGRWVGEMRMLYKNVQLQLSGAGGGASRTATDNNTVLTPENIAFLEGMGFEWSIGKPMVPWEQRFADLVKYKQGEGNCNVPRGYKEDRTYNWCTTTLLLLY
jgi:hypothetical protein